MNQFRKRWIWLMLLSVLLSACGDAPAAAPVHLPPCYPAKNAYAEPVGQQLIDIYDKSVASINDISAYDISRQNVFNELVNQVYHWSDSVDISTGEKTVRVTITYVSPELVHLIILNHYLYKRITHPPGKVGEQVKSQMSRIIGNEEYIFFIIFMSPPTNDGITIEFPLSELALTNANNLTAYVNHDDHNLERPIVLKTGLEYGFFNIPMTVTKDGNCQTVLDKNRDTRIVLSIPRIIINATDFGQQSWEYKYAPLIDVTTISAMQSNPFLLAQQVDQISPDTVQLSSRTSQLSSVDLDEAGYWAAMARFIWYETTLVP